MLLLEIEVGAALPLFFKNVVQAYYASIRTTVMYIHHLNSEKLLIVTHWGLTAVGQLDGWKELGVLSKEK